MIIRVSAGTAHLFGYRKIAADVLPTTAYLMTGDRCIYNCGFCPQAQNAVSRPRFLSRITWHEAGLEDVAQKTAHAYAAGRIKRVCLQVVSDGQPLSEIRDTACTIKRFSDVPICVSVRIKNTDELKFIAQSGVDRITIALDAAGSYVYRNTKGGSWNANLDMLYTAADLYPGRISTHLIVGLGETEEEMINILQQMQDRGITSGLFAFTPVPGTPMAGVTPPGVDSYRRIQAARYLMEGKLITASQCKFDSGYLTSYGLTRAALKEHLSGGTAFKTSGCPDCNRPYYNEKPGGVMYNYPRELTPDEISEAVNSILDNLEEES